MRTFASSFVHGGEDYVVISRPHRRPSGFEKLTPTELVVAESLLEGISIRELASSRGVSERTVTNQMAGIYRKLGIVSRHELAALVATHEP